MKFTKIRDLFAVALVAGLLTLIGLRLVYSDLPALPRLAGITFGVLAVVEAILAWQLRARITGRSGARPVQPLTAARAVALAKASSLVGALMVGVWVGVVVDLLPLRGVSPAASDDSLTAVIGVIGSLLLVGAALWLEHSCRTPKPPQERDNVDRR